MSLTIISDSEAKNFLSKPRRTHRGILNLIYIQGHPRGPGSPNAMINYGWKNPNGKVVAVARITPAPYGNGPAKAAVGVSQAKHCLYLQRQFAVGITHQDIVMFIKSYILRLREDLGVGRDFRYLLSLDDRTETLLYLGGGKDICNTAASGKTYIESGALYGGLTKSKSGARYILNGEVRSTYKSGKTVSREELKNKGARIILENQKHRFIWILAAKGSREYSEWRLLLPRTVITPIAKSEWMQPRLLQKLLEVL